MGILRWIYTYTFIHTGSESDHPSSLRETFRQRENIEASLVTLHDSIEVFNILHIIIYSYSFLCYQGPPLDENVGSHSDVAPQRSMLSAAGILINHLQLAARYSKSECITFVLQARS